METNQLPAATQSNVPATFNFFDPVQFETMMRVCKMFASSELVPDMYRTDTTLVNNVQKNPENKAIANCMIATEMAQRIGASPLMIMQNMNIIYGRPSWASKFLIGTVNTCGRFEALKYRFTNLGKVGRVPYVDYVWNGKNKAPVTKEFDGTNIDNLQCIAYTTAKGSNEVLESADVSIRLAIQEGWYTKSGSKWQTMTRQMLIYRAASFWTNAYAPELSMGMKTTEEVQDIIDIPYEEVKESTAEKVDREKAENANKTTLTMDEPKAEVKPEEKAAEQQTPPVQKDGKLFNESHGQTQATQTRRPNY